MKIPVGGVITQPFIDIFQMDKVVVFILVCSVAHLGRTIGECNEGSKECSSSEGLLVVNQ